MLLRMLYRWVRRRGQPQPRGRWLIALRGWMVRVRPPIFDEADARRRSAAYWATIGEQERARWR